MKFVFSYMKRIDSLYTKYMVYFSVPCILANLLEGFIGARGQKKAAETAAAGQREAAQLQRQTAQEALEMQREQFGYGKEVDLYNRALAERQMQQQHQAYQDQFAFAEQQRQMALQQLDYENQLRQQALGGLQPFADVGLGALPGLTQMTGQPTMQIDPSLYGLAGMQQREATPIQAYDPAIGQGFGRSIRDTLGQRHLSQAEQLEQQFQDIRGQLSAQEATEIEGIMAQIREREAQQQAEAIRQAQAPATPMRTAGMGGVMPQPVPVQAPTSAMPPTLENLGPVTPGAQPAPTPAPEAIAPQPAARSNPPVPYQDSGVTASQLIRKYGWRNVPHTFKDLQALGYSPREATNLSMAIAQRQRVASRAER